MSRRIVADPCLEEKTTVPSSRCLKRLNLTHWHFYETPKVGFAWMVTLLPPLFLSLDPLFVRSLSHPLPFAFLLPSDHPFFFIVVRPADNFHLSTVCAIQNPLWAESHLNKILKIDFSTIRTNNKRILLLNQSSKYLLGILLSLKIPFLTMSDLSSDSCTAIV